ncbi:hypothetical protein [Halosegnis marinus]|uniref:Uncharacterized protein n=1 Tax=Halosegnis marinus TaxID=3034023 RepID=A0ABD5ZT22_9EURY|nr:hypothetical protein [Halosegnis sp. DT85]
MHDGLFEEINSEGQLVVDAPLENPYFERPFNHEFGHVRLSKSTEIWDRMFALNARSVEMFFGSLDDLLAAESDASADAVEELLRGHSGIQVFQDSWRPVQEAYSEIYAAYHSQMPTKLMLENSIGALETKLAASEYDPAEIDLSKPPTSLLTDDPAAVDCFHHQHERVTISAALRIYEEATFTGDHQFMEYMSCIAQLASRDGTTGSWRTGVGRQFLEVMLAAKRIAQFTDFDTPHRQHTPRTAAEHLTRALGFDYNEDHTRGDNIKDALENVFADEASFSPQEVDRIGDVWTRMTSQPEPVSIVIENSATGDVVVSHRDQGEVVETFTESAAIMRTVFQAVLGEFSAEEAFPDASTSDFLTEVGEERYHGTAELFRKLEDAGEIKAIRESLKTEAAEAF